MKTNTSGLQQYRNRLISYLDRENLINGSYQEWYDALADFRRYMKRRYVKNMFGPNLYAYRLVTNQYGDQLDHHTISYQAPLSFTRIGWSHKTLTPVQQLRQIADWMEVGGVDLYMSACQTKELSIPSLSAITSVC